MDGNGTTQKKFKALFLFAGIGAGALGFLDAQVQLHGKVGSFESVGGVDLDPIACRDFERLTRSPSKVADLATMTPEELRAFAGDQAPDVVFMSPPCKGFSGLMSPKKAATKKYQEMNRLAVKGTKLVLDAWGTDGPGLILLENVPRIATRGKALVQEILKLLHTHGYATHKGSHDCGEIGGLAPTLVQTGYGERPGQAPRALDLEKPLGTVVGDGKHAAVVAFLAKHFTQPDGRSHPGLAADVPTGTVTARDHHSVVQVQLGLPGVAPDATASFVSQFNGRSVGAEAGAPLPTTTGRNHLAEVRAFLVKYYGSDGSATSQQQSLFDPLHTVTAKARFGLVVIAGVEYQITDIGMRMLLPEELFRAQSFPRGYVIAAPFEGRTLNKTEQIELAGNSVCPVLAEALVRANCGGSVAAAEVA